MKRISSFFLLLIAAVAFVACDKIEGPYITPDDSAATDIEFPALTDADLYRKVLIEEYTGQRCTNCPDGHRELESLKERYGDTLVAIGIHAGIFANPMGAFTNDFRTEEGNALYSDYNVAAIGTPAGVVGRAQYNNTYALNISSWQQAIRANAQQPCAAAVQLINVYDPATQTLTAHTRTTRLNGCPNDLLLALYVIEDGIIGPQKDGEETIAEYEHNHVLRGSLNGTYGVPLMEAEEDGTYLKSYSLDCGSKTWNAANCSVIAILMDASTREVIQVQQAKFF